MKQMRWYDYLTYNIYWLGLNMATGSLTPIILPYLVGLFVGDTGIAIPTLLAPLLGKVWWKGTALGALSSAGLIVAIIIQPLAGLLSDRSTLRWGRRRPFIFIGTLLDLVFLALIAVSGNYWLLFVSGLLLQFSSNVAHGALQGIIPDLVPEDQRGRASGVKAMMELLPVILVGFTVGPLVGAGKLWPALAIVMGSLLLTMLITMVAVKEEPLRQPVKQPLGPPMARIVLLTLIFAVVTTAFAALVGLPGRWFRQPGISQLLGMGLTGLAAMAGAIVLGVWWSARVGIGEGAKAHPSFIWWVINRLLYLAAVGSIQRFAQYFLGDVLNVSNAPAAAGDLMKVVGIFTVLSALASGWLADRFGRRLLVALSGVVAAVGTASLLLASNMTMVTLGGAIIGLSAGIFMTTNWALGTDLVPPAEAGLYLGVSNLAGAGAGVVGAGIGGPLADFFNVYQKGLGWLVIFAIYSALFLLSTVTLLKVQGERKPSA